MNDFILDFFTFFRFLLCVSVTFGCIYRRKITQHCQTPAVWFETKLGVVTTSHNSRLKSDKTLTHTVTRVTTGKSPSFLLPLPLANTTCCGMPARPAGTAFFSKGQNNVTHTHVGWFGEKDLLCLSSRGGAMRPPTPYGRAQALLRAAVWVE